MNGSKRIMDRALTEARAAALRGEVPVGAVIVLDGEVVIAPVVRSVMTDTAFINGDFTKSEAERIAAGVTAR